jgi:hypothetical protein
LGGGEVGIVSSDFHRLTGATAKINSKNTHSNQALYTLFFHRAAAKPIRPLFQTGSQIFSLRLLGAYFPEKAAVTMNMAAHLMGCSPHCATNCAGAM